ncbi:MAG: M28 family peptidase [Candidatus Odinarchaeia archaeon]
MTNTKKKYFLLLFTMTIILSTLTVITTPHEIHAFSQPTETFNETIAWSHLENYSSFSPILPGTPNNTAFINYATSYFNSINWDVEIQNWTHTNGVQLHNIIAKSPQKGENLIILGAHYDNRIKADKDPDIDKRDQPVPGINDGGSGTAILLELARVLDIPDSIELWIVLFDAEDQGGIAGWEGGLYGYCIGSSYFADNLDSTTLNHVKLVLILDIVGGKDLVLHKETSSTQFFVDKIWAIAHSENLGSIFLNETGSNIIDDHTPFLHKGIPAVDIIQQVSADRVYSFFKWHHTTNDTIENCDKTSLFAIGSVTEKFIETLSISDLNYTVNTLPVLLIGGAVAVIIVVSVFLIIKKIKNTK